MKNKRQILLMLVLVLIVSTLVVGCSSSSTGSQNPPKTVVEQYVLAYVNSETDKMLPLVEDNDLARGLNGDVKDEFKIVELQDAMIEKLKATEISNLEEITSKDDKNNKAVSGKIKFYDLNAALYGPISELRAKGNNLRTSIIDSKDTLIKAIENAQQVEKDVTVYLEKDNGNWKISDDDLNDLFFDYLLGGLKTLDDALDID